MAENFPTRRFTSAGATREETTWIREQYDRSDISVQKGMLEHFKSLSTSGLREYLANWRKVHLAPEALKSAPEAPQTPAVSTTTVTPEAADDDAGAENGPPAEDPDDEDDAAEGE